MLLLYAVGNNDHHIFRDIVNKNLDGGTEYPICIGLRYGKTGIDAMPAIADDPLPPLPHCVRLGDLRFECLCDPVHQPPGHYNSGAGLFHLS